MSRVLVSDQANNIIAGVGSYLPDLDIRVRGWQSAVDAMPTVPERELKAAMAQVVKLAQSLPTAKGPLSADDVATVQATMNCLALALEKVLSIQEHNTGKAQELKDRFHMEEITLASQLQTLQRQSRYIQQERKVVYDSILSMRKKIDNTKAKIYKLEKNIAAENGYAESRGNVMFVPFLPRGAVTDQESMAAMESEVQIMKTDCETWRNSIEACEDGQEDRVQSLKQIKGIMEEVAQRKAKVHRGQTLCDDYLTPALPKLESLRKAQEALQPYTVGMQKLESADVTKLYDAVLHIAEETILTQGVAGEARPIFNRVKGLPFSGELSRDLEAVQIKMNTV